MNANPLFSVIIPHKNRPKMLQRCLDSIPRRDDVQIIVVDDKSDPKQVDFNNFPGQNDSHVEIYFTKKGKGAGYARNVGLEHAKGKWVLFADSDDWYLDNLSEMMDKYADSEFDMLVFRTKRIDYKENDVKNTYDIFFDEAILKNNYERIRYSYPCPVGKFIRRRIVEKNGIRFQEIRYANDVMFALKVSFYSQKIKVIDDVIYCVYQSNNSLTRNENWRNPYTRIKVSLEAYLYLKKIGKENYVEGEWIIIWNRLWRISKIKAIFVLFTNIRKVFGIQVSISKFLQTIQLDYPKYYSFFFKINSHNIFN